MGIEIFDLDYENLPPEQKELIDQVDDFAAQMKARLMVKFKEGYSGWKTEYTTEDIIHNVVMRLPRMMHSDDPVEVGISNWLLINHLIKQNQNATRSSEG